MIFKSFYTFLNILYQDILSMTLAMYMKPVQLDSMCKWREEDLLRKKLRQSEPNLTVVTQRVRVVICQYRTLKTTLCKQISEVDDHVPQSSLSGA